MPRAKSEAGDCPRCKGRGELETDGVVQNCPRCAGSGVHATASFLGDDESERYPHDLVILPEDAGVGSYMTRKYEPGAREEKEGE